MDQYPFDCKYCGTVQLIGDMDDDCNCYACGAPFDFSEHMLGGVPVAESEDK